MHILRITVAGEGASRRRMGMFDRWRRRTATSSPDEAFEALAAEMTRDGVLIITRDEGAYTVYWARKHEHPINPKTTVDALKRSVEGRGATVFEGMLACRAQAMPH